MEIMNWFEFEEFWDSITQLEEGPQSILFTLEEVSFE